MKKLLSTILILIISAQICIWAADSAQLSNVYWDNSAKGLRFTISYQGTPGDAWIGIVPVGTAHDEYAADRVDIKYLYLRNLKNGASNLMECPGLTPGEYEVHVYGSDSGGKYLCGQRFSTNTTPSSSSKPKQTNTSSTQTTSGPWATLSNVRWNSTMKGVEFNLSYKDTASDAWVGIVPVGTAHDERAADNVDIKYAYLRDLKNNGTNLLQYPSLSSGEYELHVYASDSGGKYLCGQRFSTNGSSSSTSSSTGAKQQNSPASEGPWASLTDVKWNDEYRGVNFTLSYKGVADDAWIGIVPVGTAHDEKVADKVARKFAYVKNINNGATSITQFPSLTDTGEYELHVYANDNGGKFLCSAKFNSSDTKFKFPSKSKQQSTNNPTTTTANSTNTQATGPWASLSNVHWDSGMKGVVFNISYKDTSNDAWVGIVPVGTAHDEYAADRVDIKYVYLRDLKNNDTNLLQYPSLSSGEYELHVYASDNGGKYLCGQKFTVR